MLNIAMVMTIETLWKNGFSKKEISRRLGPDRKTVRKVIGALEKLCKVRPKRKVRESKLDQYREKIIGYLEKGLSGVRICEELVSEGVPAKIRTVTGYIAKLSASKKICVRFYTKPGEEAQVDFGYVGRFVAPDGKQRKAWVFNMRLSYSRLDYYEVVFDQKVKTFVMCHSRAFRYFGGVPKTVKIDNLKAAILEANFYEPMQQETYRQFSVHYGFGPIPCRVRQPQEKGKVEAGIKFVQGNFFAGRKFEDFKELEMKLSDWINTKCNMRKHGTTQRIPRELFEQEEHSALISLPLTDFVFPEIVTRKVFRDCHITVDQSTYSVPYEYVGKEVDVWQDGNLIKVCHEGEQIAVHPCAPRPGSHCTNESHYPKYRYFSPDSEECRAMYRNKMREIGSCAEQTFELLLKEKPYQWHRTTAGILSLQKQFSKSVVELACQRAMAFNALQYKVIKSICKSGCYNLPIEPYEHYKN